MELSLLQSFAGFRSSQTRICANYAFCESLSLPLRRSHGQPVEFLAHLDLARQARARLHLVGEIEHVLFHGRRLADLLPPGVVDIDVAGRAGAGAAAFRLDAGNGVLDRRLHDGRADLAFDGARRAGGIDESDFDHGGMTNRRREAERGNGTDKEWPSGCPYLWVCAGRRQCGEMSGVRLRRGQWPRKTSPRRAAIAALASTVALLSSSTAWSSAAAPDLPLATRSNCSAARATRQAPIPRAEPVSVWAAAAASAGSAPAMRSSMITVWRTKISRTSRSSRRSPSVMRLRWSSSMTAHCRSEPAAPNTLAAVMAVITASPAARSFLIARDSARETTKTG